MAAIIKIEVTQTGGIDKLKSDVESIGSSAEKAGGGFNVFSEMAVGAARAAGEAMLNLAGAAISKVTEVIGDSITAAKESNMVAAQTAQVIKSTGSAAGVTAQHVLDYASALSAASGKSLFGDEQIAQSTNLLLTFTNIRGATLDAATAISVDMAQALGGAPKDAAIQLGKALNDPVKGITALTRVGVTFSAEQKAQIQAMQEAGDTAGAQAIILAELNKEFGGSAAAAAAADGGWAQFHDRLGEVEETIGKAILPILGTLVGMLNDSILPVVESAANALGPFITNLQAAFATGAEDGGGLIGGLINALYSLDTLSPIFDTVGDAITRIASLWARAGMSGMDFAGSIGYVADQMLGFTTGLGPVHQAINIVTEVLQHLAATFTDAPTPIEGFLNVLGEVSPTFAFVRATIEGVMPAIQVTVTTVLGVIGEFWKQNGADIMVTVQSTWATIKQIIDVALPLIQGIITGVLAVIVGFIRDHGKTIQQVLGDTWNIIKNLIQGALAIIQGVLTAALAIFRGDWAGAWEAIKTMSVTVTLALGNIVKSFLDIIAGYFGTSLSQIGTLWAHNWEQIKLFVTNINWSQLGADVVNGIISGLSGASGKLADTARKAAMDAYNAAKNALGISSPSKLMARDVGAPIVQGIATGIQLETPNLLNTIGTMASSAMASATDLVTSFGNAFTSANLPGTISTVGRNAIQGLITGVVSQTTAATNGVNTLLGNVSGAFKNSGLEGDAKDIGGNVMDGLIDGIKDKVGDAVKAAHKAAQNLLGGFTSALDIHSPSGVMADLVGSPIITGIMQGMQQALPGLVNLIDDLGTQVIEANHKWKVDVVNSFHDSINEIDGEIEKMGDSISNTINDAFLGAASLDRAKARAIDTLKDIGAAQQQNVQAQLAAADEVASKMSDPAAAAKYFKMRSDQIFELAKLQSQLVEGTDPATKAAQLAALQSAENAQLTNRANRMGTETAGIHALFDPQIQAIQNQAALTADQVTSNRRLQDQIALITDAQKNEMAGAAKSATSPAAALIAQLSDLKMKADSVLRQGGSQFSLPAELDGNATINALRALTNQLSMLTSGGNSSTVTSSNSVFNYAPTITTSAAVTPAPAATMRALANV